MEVTFLETKVGKGFKIVVNGQWLYTSKKALFRAIYQKKACRFQPFEEFVAEEKKEETPNAN